MGAACTASARMPSRHKGKKGSSRKELSESRTSRTESESRRDDRLATGILAVALLATPRMASAGVHFSFGIGLPFFGAVVAPGPAAVVPSPAYVLPPAYYPYPYPPVVAYGPPG